MEASNKSKRSIIRSFAIAGLLVPLILILSNWVGFTIDRNHIPWTMTYQHYVWPSSILLMATHDNFSIHSLIVLCISIAVNVLVYTVVGLFVKGITVAWRRLFTAA